MMLAYCGLEGEKKQYPCPETQWKMDRSAYRLQRSHFLWHIFGDLCFTDVLLVLTVDLCSHGGVLMCLCMIKKTQEFTGR